MCVRSRDLLGHIQITNQDLTISAFATLITLISLPLLMHVLLHTFVWGWPKSSESSKESDKKYRAAPARPDKYYLSTTDLTTEESILMRQRDIGFYLNVPECIKYFSTHGGGFCGYFKCCRKKLRLLMKMTAGIWDLELVRNFEVVSLARKYDDDTTDAETNHQEVISSLGKGHSLLWQFFPLGKHLS